MTAGRLAARIGREAARALVAADVCRIDPGLTEAELARIESTFGFEFSDDHRSFLAAGLPLDAEHSRGWPDWRGGDPEHLRARLDRPVDGVLFQVGHGTFWHPDWGPRPESTADALAAARAHLDRVPRMVPVFSHRYLPAGRGNWGHPVLSMHGTDIIVYGDDLPDYVRREFDVRRGFGAPDPGAAERVIGFWRDLVG